MSQLQLFEAREEILCDDERGRIAYTPDFVSAALAQAWFAQLRAQTAWQAQRRRMYDRDVDVPRLTAHFQLLPAASAGEVPAGVLAAADHVARATGVAFNSVGLNLYRDGRDSVAPHNDHLHVLVVGFPIALVSLGATRRMTIRAKELPRRVLHLDLQPGSLLMMSYATQLHYTHGIPKTDAAVGERISLAFRVKPDEAANDPYR